MDGKIDNKFSEEVTKLFNKIPVTKGIGEIVLNSKYKFSTGITSYPNVYYQNWKAVVDVLDFFENYANKIELEIDQNSIEKSKGCYNCILRLYYSDEELMIEDYSNIKTKFEKLGEKITIETIESENYEIKSQFINVFYTKDKSIPCISFSFNKNQTKRENLMIIHYKNCIID